MTDKAESKLQIRARLLCAIQELQAPANKTSQAAASIISSLNDIEDKAAVLEILMKELKKGREEEEINILFCIMYELLDKNTVEETLLKELANPSLNDKIKSDIINLLRGFGNNVNYEDYLQYLDNPQEVIDADTTKLLSNAIVNPEAQIDFLDFINALPEREAKMLLESLNSDYDGDNLANILTPLILSKPYSELAFIAIRDIGSSKSEIGLNTLNYIMENIDDLRIKAQAQKSINLLKLSGIKEDNTHEFYKKILAESPVYKCFASLPDGHGNIGIIFSRKNSFDLIQMFAAVINDIDGIVDAFGFYEISLSEFKRIVSKFYSNDETVEVSPEFCKYMLINAEKTSRLMHNEMSYEYAAWRTIINDIELQEVDLKQGASNLGFKEPLLKQLYKTGFFDRWFFDNSGEFGEFLSVVIDSKNTDLLFKNELPVDSVFTPAVVRTIDYRLLLISYLLRYGKSDEYALTSNLVYSLIYEEKSKRKFFENIIKKSIYEYFLNIKEQYYSKTFAPSVFTRRQEAEKNKIDINFVEDVLSKIETDWVEGEAK